MGTEARLFCSASSVTGSTSSRSSFATSAICRCSPCSRGLRWPSWPAAERCFHAHVAALLTKLLTLRREPYAARRCWLQAGHSVDCAAPCKCELYNSATCPLGCLIMLSHMLSLRHTALLRFICRSSKTGNRDVPSYNPHPNFHSASSARLAALHVARQEDCISDPLVQVGQQRLEAPHRQRHQLLRRRQLLVGCVCTTKRRLGWHMHHMPSDG